MYVQITTIENATLLGSSFIIFHFPFHSSISQFFHSSISPFHLSFLIFHFYHTTRFANSLLQVHQVDIHEPMAEEDDNGFHKRALLLVHQR